VRPERLSHWKIPVTSSGIELATFRLVAQYLNQRHRVTPVKHLRYLNSQLQIILSHSILYTSSGIFWYFVQTNMWPRSGSNPLWQNKICLPQNAEHSEIFRHWMEYVATLRETSGNLFCGLLHNTVGMETSTTGWFWKQSQPNRGIYPIYAWTDKIKIMEYLSHDIQCSVRGLNWESPKHMSSMLPLTCYSAIFWMFADIYLMRNTANC
jgi:hypothetical protein